MASKIATILALSAIALAHPRKHHHSFGTGFAFGTGTGGGFAKPTGNAPFPVNGTDGMGAGSPTGATASVPVISVTVQPLPASSPAAAIPTSFGNVAAPSSGLPVEAASASSTTCSPSTTTTTSTTIQYVTVTADAASSGSAAPLPSLNGAPVLASLTGADASSVALTSTASVSAGQFFGIPSGSYSNGGGFGGSSAAAIPTTLATIVGLTPSVPLGSSSFAISMPSASASTIPTVPSTGSSGGKRGLSYNTASLLSAFSGTGMSWAYNWGASPGGTIPSGMEFVPMCWGLSFTSAWNAAAKSAIASGSTHVLSFNEPDLASQGNMDPATAAKNHISFLNPLSGSAQIGSPAITNGAGTSPLMGLDWMKSFFDACNGQCKIDFLTFHWYDSASNLAYFKSHVDDVVKFAQSKGISKVWLTEFGASGSDSEVASFIKSATAYLDGNSAVERYAYFMASDGILLSGSGLSTLGKAYAG